MSMFSLVNLTYFISILIFDETLACHVSLWYLYSNKKFTTIKMECKYHYVTYITETSVWMIFILSLKKHCVNKIRSMLNFRYCSEYIIIGDFYKNTPTHSCLRSNQRTSKRKKAFSHIELDKMSACSICLLYTSRCV